jgi:hypothetical protein
MTIRLSLSPALEAQLQQRAQAAGKDISTFVQDVVLEKLSGDRLEQPNAQDRADVWLKWVAERRSATTTLDDSRESIYAGRGE